MGYGGRYGRHFQDQVAKGIIIASAIVFLCFALVPCFGGSQLPWRDSYEGGLRPLVGSHVSLEVEPPAPQKPQNHRHLECNLMSDPEPESLS